MTEELIIGLEIHIQLNTKTKLFCGCANKQDKENSLTCPICLGMPGSKPSINKKAVEHALKLALALNCEIPKSCSFSRKTYFYPDMSKNFQITQYEMPIAIKGNVKVTNKKINIRRINLEEDPASLKHQEDCSLIDYNRCGVPLVEIVTEPDFNSAKEVREFLSKLKAILIYLKVFDIENGKLRVDVNVSLGKHKRVEIKNITGFREIEKAISYEVKRQEIRIKKGLISSNIETYYYNQETSTTHLSRVKESEEEYGYIFEPDLPKLVFSKDFLDKIRDKISELPDQKIARLQKDYQINEVQAVSITTEPEIADLYERVSKIVGKENAVFVASFFSVYLKKILNYNKIALKDTKINEKNLSELIDMLIQKKISDRAADLILRELVFNPKLDSLIKKYAQLDNKEIDKIVDDVLKENKKALEDYKQDSKVLHFLVGQIIKKSNAKIDAKKALELIKKRLS